MAEPMDHPGGVEPFMNLLPALGIAVEYPGDLVKWNSSPAEDIGQFRHGARGAALTLLERKASAVHQDLETVPSMRRARFQTNQPEDFPIASFDSFQSSTPIEILPPLCRTLCRPNRWKEFPSKGKTINSVKHYRTQQARW